MNTAHLGREGAEKLINNVRSVSNRIAILMDTKGPEVRTTVLAEPIPFKAGDRIKKCSLFICSMQVIFPSRLEIRCFCPDSMLKRWIADLPHSHTLSSWSM